jgi:FAD synthase
MPNLIQISGTKKSGAARGRKLGFPTVNFAVENLPEISGVFAGEVFFPGI